MESYLCCVDSGASKYLYICNGVEILPPMCLTLLGAHDEDV